MAYTGIARPFIEPLQNNLELSNEILTLINSYFMFLFSDFVPDLKAKYHVGWVNIGVIVALVLINMSIITIVQGKQVCRRAQLKYLKRKHSKLMKK